MTLVRRIVPDRQSHGAGFFPGLDRDETRDRVVRRRYFSRREAGEFERDPHIGRGSYADQRRRNGNALALIDPDLRTHGGSTPPLQVDVPILFRVVVILNRDRDRLASTHQGIPRAIGGCMLAS